MIRTDGLRLFPVESTGVPDSVLALALLSAAGHVGALLWALSGAPSHEIDTQAGSAAAIEVTLVAGPARGNPEDHPKPDPEPSASAQPSATPPPSSTEAKPAQAPPDYATSADSTTGPPTAAANAFAMTLPAAADAPPVPPPKPARFTAVPAAPAGPRTPAAAAASAVSPIQATTENAAAQNARDRATAAASASEASNGGNRGAAPRADNPAPSYPASARRRGQEGRVVLRVMVLPGGDAGDVALEKSSGVNSLDRAALETVRRWRFSPARKNGRPVAATVQVPIRFALK